MADFLRNLSPEMAAIDFFVLSTLGFDLLCAFNTARIMIPVLRRDATLDENCIAPGNRASQRR